MTLGNEAGEGWVGTPGSMEGNWAPIRADFSEMSEALSSPWGQNLRDTKKNAIFEINYFLKQYF